MINTVAGNGTLDYTGDGGLATSASLNSPFGVFVDASGNIFIADYGNNRIRKVNASDGKINTVAGNGNLNYSGDGGLATSASLNSPIVSLLTHQGTSLSRIAATIVSGR